MVSKFAFSSILFFTVTWLSAVRGQQNITVDSDEDNEIIYTPSNAWEKSAENSLDVGGSHMLTSNNGVASFSFTGVAVYFWSPLWPYHVSTALSLDNELPQLVDLQDHNYNGNETQQETVQSTIVWSKTNLVNTQHILTVTIGAGEPYAIVDGITFTVQDSASPLSSESLESSTITTSGFILPVLSSSSSITSEVTIETTSKPFSTITTSSTVDFPASRLSSSTASDTTTTANSSSLLSGKHAPIIGGAVGGFVGLCLIAGLLLLCRQRRRTRDSVSFSSPAMASLNRGTDTPPIYRASLASSEWLPQAYPSLVKNANPWSDSQYSQFPKNNAETESYSGVYDLSPQPGIPAISQYMERSAVAPAVASTTNQVSNAPIIYPAHIQQYYPYRNLALTQSAIPNAVQTYTKHSTALSTITESSATSSVQSELSTMQSELGCSQDSERILRRSKGRIQVANLRPDPSEVPISPPAYTFK